MLEPAGGLRKGLLREGGRPQGTPLRDAPLPGGGYAKPSRGRAWLAEGAPGPRGDPVLKREKERRARRRWRAGPTGPAGSVGRACSPRLSFQLPPPPGEDGVKEFFKAFAESRLRLAQAPTGCLVVEPGDTTSGAQCAYAQELPEAAVFPPARGEVSWLVARAHGQPATLERKGRGWLAGTAGLGVHGTMVGGECRDREGADVAALSRSLQRTERLSKGRFLRNPAGGLQQGRAAPASPPPSLSLPLRGRGLSECHLRSPRQDPSRLCKGLKGQRGQRPRCLRRVPPGGRRGA